MHAVARKLGELEVPTGILPVAIHGSWFLLISLRAELRERTRDYTVEPVFMPVPSAV